MKIKKNKVKFNINEAGTILAQIQSFLRRGIDNKQIDQYIDEMHRRYRKQGSYSPPKQQTVSKQGLKLSKNTAEHKRKLILRLK